jgi:ferrous iron transport protein B
MELNVPMILALNMMDEIRATGSPIDIRKLEDLLGIPWFPFPPVKTRAWMN